MNGFLRLSLLKTNCFIYAVNQYALENLSVVLFLYPTVWPQHLIFISKLLFKLYEWVFKTEPVKDQLFYLRGEPVCVGESFRSAASLSHGLALTR